MYDFAGKIFWITGASSGIGEALAQALAKEGAHLILSGRRTDALDTLAGALSTDTLVLPFETTDWNALESAAQTAIGWKGTVDGLINNAGISQRSLAIDTAPTVYRRIIDVDLLAPILLTQLVLPHMVKRGSGHIVGISSVAGRIGVPLRTAYCAAKHGLIGYMDALRAETQTAHGLCVTTVLPGSVRTDVSRNALDENGARRGKSDSVIDNGMDPDECARQIVEGMRSGASEILIAEGQERVLAELRQSDAPQLFKATAAFGAQLAEKDAGLT